MLVHSLIAFPHGNTTLARIPRPSLLDQNSKIIELCTPIYEFIDIFHEIGKNSDVKRQPEEHILAFQEHLLTVSLL